MIYFRNKKGFASLIGLLLALGIIVCLVHKAFNVYFKKSDSDKQSKETISKGGIDTSSYQSILKSTKTQIKDIEKQMLNRENRILNRAGRQN